MEVTIGSLLVLSIFPTSTKLHSWPFPARLSQTYSFASCAFGFGRPSDARRYAMFELAARTKRRAIYHQCGREHIAVHSAQKQLAFGEVIDHDPRPSSCETIVSTHGPRRRLVRVLQGCSSDFLDQAKPKEVALVGVGIHVTHT